LEKKSSKDLPKKFRKFGPRPQLFGPVRLIHFSVQTIVIKSMSWPGQWVYISCIFTVWILQL